jgi:tetratricopeptide (TPR) repeat protein
MHMRRIEIVRIAVALGFGLPGALLASEPAIDGTFFARIERAVVVADKPVLLECRSVLQKQLSADPKNAPSMWRYALAYTDWRLDQLRLKDNKEQDEGYLKEAEANLHTTVSAEPSNAEAQALLGGVLGQRIGKSSQLGMTLGPKAQTTLDRAYKDAPSNPRVALQRGVSAVFTPKAYGGSLAKAEKELRRAWSLFDKEPADKPWPNWGRLDTLAWLGQVLQAKGDIEGARNAYNQSLALQPDFRWVRDSLLPALDRKAAKKP